MLLAFNPSGSAPSVESESIPFGWIEQGKTKYGTLRDKSVQHLSATGEITISNRIATAANITPDPSYLSYGLKNVRINGTYTAPNVGSHRIWGRDSSLISTYGRERYLHLTGIFTGKYAAADFIEIVDELSFDETGSYALWFLGTPRDRAPEQWDMEDGSGEGSKTVQQCFYLALNKPGSAPGLYYKTLSMLRDSKGAYCMTPVGKVYANQLPSVPWHLGYTWSDFALITSGNLTDSASASEGSSATYARVKSLLTQPKMTGYVSRNFTLNSVNFDWGALVPDLLKQQRYVDANILLTVFDMVSVKADLESWKNLAILAKDLTKILPTISTVSEGILSLKSWASLASNAKLAVSYGVLPTVGDTQKVFAGYGRLAKYAAAPNRKHTRRPDVVSGFLDSPIRSTYTLTAEVAKLPRDFLGNTMREIQWLNSWGLAPNFSMLWDAMPFSFCVDWVVNIGSIAESEDAVLGAGSTQYFPISHCMQTTKRLWSPKLSDLLPGISGCTGSITYSWYDRLCSRELPSTSIRMEEAGSFNSWAEATALVIQGVLKR